MYIVYIWKNRFWFILWRVNDDLLVDYFFLISIFFSLVEEKATIVRRLLAEVELGVEEAAMMSQLASHLSGLEGERAKLRAQVNSKSKLTVHI